MLNCVANVAFTKDHLLVHPSVRPPIQLQHTDEHTESSRHYPLPKSQHTPLFCNPSRRALPQRYTQQLSSNRILLPRLRSCTRPHTRHPNPK